MKKSSFTSQLPYALALVAGASALSCGDGDSSQSLEDSQISRQLQSEVDSALKQDHASSSRYRSVRPVLTCVEQLPGKNKYQAHWGYTNSDDVSISIPIGLYNRFWAPPIRQGQPTKFEPGTHADVVEIPFSGSSASAWVVGVHFDIATRWSKKCPSNTGSGGATGTGGGAGSGGSSGTGGSAMCHGTGGAGTGGVASSGGNVGSGGRPGTGGSVATGGTGTGGIIGTGGTVSTGGVVGTGGDVGTGGAVSTGGVVGTGGDVGTGGTVSTGGVVGTGGDVGTGGTVSTGGAGTGGMVGSGGVVGTGGDVGTGGTISTGGVIGTGGAGTGGSGTGGAAPTCPAVCNDGNPCTIDSCDASTGLCRFVAAVDGASCSDGNSCTKGDQCLGGVCTAGAPLICADADQCHAAGVCDQATGACTNPIAPTGTVCNDGNACTSNDSCQAGACIGGTPKTCTASGTCHVAGVCAPATGICSDPIADNGSTCDDANMCSTGDACQAGVCTAATVNPPSTCVGPLCTQCTADNCVPSTDGCAGLADAADRALCEDLYSCFINPTNACVTQGDPLKCWCGSNPTTCVTSDTPPTQANGPCRDKVFAAAKSSTAATIKQRFVDPNFPLGRAVNLLNCRGNFCPDECMVP